jgi:hypothetical protein
MSILGRDGNSGICTRYPPGTRPDGDWHGYHFSPVGGTHTRPGVRRVRGGDLMLHMGNPWVPVKHSANKIFQPNIYWLTLTASPHSSRSPQSPTRAAGRTSTPPSVLPTRTPPSRSRRTPPRRKLLTVYFGTPSMLITLWFGFDYGTNRPLGTLII